MRRKRNLLSLIGLTIILVLGPMVYFGIIKPHKSTAAWFDDKWFYRKSVNITNSSGSALTDFQVSISIGTSANIAAGKMKSDCSDIRITDTNGKLLPHWIEGPCNSTTEATVWTKVPNIPTSGGTVYVYYGNPSATNTSSTTKTFIREITGVTGAWTFNEGVGTTARDYSGNNNTGTLGAGSLAPGWVTGMYGIGLSFDGSNDYVNVGNSASLTPSSAITISVWVKPSGTQNLYAGVIGNQTSSSGWILRYVGSNTLAVRAGDGSNQINAGSTGTTPSGSWTNVVFTYDGYKTTFYFNGIPETSVATSVRSIAYASNTTYVGSEALVSNRFFNGIIDEPRVYNRALTPAEVSDLYGTGSDRYGYVTTNYPGKELVRKWATTNPTSSLSSTEEQSKAPVAYWSFDEGQGTIAYDATSNKNNGTLGAGTSAPTWQTEDMCVSGKCLYYDGSNDYVSIPTTNFDSLGAMTISMWIKGENLNGAYIRLLQKSDTTGATKGFGIVTGGSNSKLVGFYQQNYVTAESNKRTAVTLNNNTWYHVAMTFSGGTTVTMYVNGVNSTEAVGGDGGISAGTGNNFAIGKKAGAASNSFKGFIDDVKIYPYARSAAEIKADYNARGTQKGTSARIGSKSVEILSEGLVGYWKMNEIGWTGTANEVVDSSGNSNNGQSKCAGTCSVPSTSTGKFGNGGSFDGTDDYVKITNSTSLNYSSQTTISAWVYNRETNSSRIPIAKGGYNTSGWYWWIDTTSWRVQLNTTSQNSAYSSGRTIPTNEWHHLTTVIDQTNSTIKYYYDGVLINTSTGTIQFSNNSSNSIYIADYIGSGTYAWNGILDEVRIYNRALSPAEVQQLYNWAPGPVAYYNFNEGVGSSAFDTSGNGNNGGWSGTGTHWAAGKFGKTANFDGSTDYIELPTTNLNFGTKPYTIEMWVNAHNYVTGADTRGTILSYFNDTHRIQLNNTNELYIEWYDGGAYPHYSYASFPLNTWKHIATKYNGTKVYVYIDGVEKYSTNVTNITPSGTKVTLGRQSYGTPARYYDGSVDDVRIYNYARTQKQIVEDMNAGHPAGGSPVGSQVAKYSFDEGYGTTLRNDISGGVSLSLGTGASAPSWSLDGKYGKALSFDGGGDFAYTANTALMAGAGQTYPSVSFSAWVNPTSSAVSKTIIHKNSEFRMTTDANSKPNCSIYAGGSWQTAAVGSTALTLNSWQHVLCNYDGANIKVWINGVNKGSQAETDQLTSFSSTALYIARDSTTAAGTFQGLIDDIKIYNYSLSADEIYTDFNRGSALILGSLSSGTGNTAPNTAASQEYCIPGDTASCSPPIGRWDFNEGVGSTAYDSSGNGNNGVLGTGSLAPTWAAGKIGKGLSFDGNDGAFVYTTIGNRGTQDFTLSFWVKTNANTYGYILSPNYYGSAGSWYVNYYGNSNGNMTAGAHFSGGTAGVQSNSIRDNKWHFIVAVYDRDNKILLYKDGVYYNSSASIAAYSSEVLGDNNTLSIGAQTSPPSGNFFSGLIDQVRIYNYARSPAQIAWDYNRGGPVAWYDFDECQGGTAHNRQPSTSNLDGTITIGPLGTQAVLGTCAIGTGSTAAWGNGSSGKFNASLNFDGTDDYVSLTSAINFSTATSWTVAGWFKRTGTSSSVESLVNNCYNNNCFGLSLTGSSLRWETGSPDWNRVSGYTLPTTWTFVTAIFSGSTGNWSVSWYKDGVFQSTTSSTYLFNTPSINYFGGPGTGGGAAINMDEVRIYNYALTATQIKILYNEGGAVRFGPSEGNP